MRSAFFLVDFFSSVRGWHQINLTYGAVVECFSNWTIVVEIWIFFNIEVYNSIPLMQVLKHTSMRTTLVLLFL